MKTEFLLSAFAAVSLLSCHAQEAAKPEEVKSAKTVPAAAEKPAASEKASDPAPKPAAADGDVAKLKLGVVPVQLKYDKTVLNVKPGQKVMLLLQNARDAQPHNFLLVKPGKLQAIGLMAEKMAITDPALAAKRNYIPESPDILAHSTRMVNIGQNDLIEFTAPAEPGDYPYLCTFPGHFRLMNGVLKVAP